jgi:CheY-like chemotaxis protein
VPAKTRILAVEDDEWRLEVKVILLDRVLSAIDGIELIWFLKAPKQARTTT